MGWAQPSVELGERALPHGDGGVEVAEAAEDERNPVVGEAHTVAPNPSPSLSVGVVAVVVVMGVILIVAVFDVVFERGGGR